MVWLFGAGPMSVNYLKVLQSLNCDILVIGRSEESAKKFQDNVGVPVISGGVEAFLESNPALPDSAIICVSIEQLTPVAKKVVEYGVKKILLEKPGGLNSEELEELQKIADENNAQVMIAYNRRHYSSVLTAKKMIEEDGGVSSFNFEITEWSHVIQNHQKDSRVMNSWFLGNTSHVVDTAFFLGGEPEEISCFAMGGVSWHPSSSSFAGAGVSVSGALFSYYGNWESPGRWTLDVLTKKRRYIFCPMEQLHVQEIGSVKVEQFPVDDSLDSSFKPGLYVQVEKFLAGECEELCSLESQVKHSKVYEQMAGY